LDAPFTLRPAFPAAVAKLCVRQPSAAFSDDGAPTVPADIPEVRALAFAAFGRAGEADLVDVLTVSVFA